MERRQSVKLREREGNEVRCGHPKFRTCALERRQWWQVCARNGRVSTAPHRTNSTVPSTGRMPFASICWANSAAAHSLPRSNWCYPQLPRHLNMRTLSCVDSWVEVAEELRRVKAADVIPSVKHRELFCRGPKKEGGKFNSK
jgi:hypothetical protein